MNSITKTKGSDVIGYATHHDEPMLFPTRAEAELHCNDDEEPIPLVDGRYLAAAAPRAPAHAPDDCDIVEAVVRSGAIGRVALTYSYKDKDGTTRVAPTAVCKEFVRLLAAAAPQALGWQPIETAPRDGTPFLAWRNGLIEQCDVLLRDDGEVWRCGIRSWHAEVFPERVPTYWMPRPAAPGATTEDSSAVASPQAGGAELPAPFTRLMDGTDVYSAEQVRALLTAPPATQAPDHFVGATNMVEAPEAWEMVAAQDQPREWYTPAEIRARIASHDYSAELMLQHAMHWLPAAGSTHPADVSITAQRVDTSEPYGWTVPGTGMLWRGADAEQDAREEARRVGGYAEAIALYRPAPQAVQYVDGVSLVDETGGEYVEVDQSGRDGLGKAAIDPAEWPALRQAIDQMVALCRPVAGVEDANG